ncbi:MAG: HDOD domain-containing protein [Fibrobacterota bacterium]
MASIRDRIIQRVRDLEDLPPAGGAFLEIQRLIADHRSDAASLARIVEKDVWLTAKLLKMVNSVYFSGRYGEIGSVQQAVVRLGFEQICKFCLAMQVQQMFPPTSSLIDGRAFWHHSIAVAMVTRDIAEKSPVEGVDSGTAYVAGLLHDAGTLILDRHFTEVYRKIRETASAYSENVFRIEQKLLDIEHGEIGGLILEKWKFPESIVQAVNGHHFPDRAELEWLPLAQLVHLSDFACSVLGAGEPGDALPQGFSHGAWHDLKIDPDQIPPIVAQVEEEIEKIKILLNVVR